MKKKIHYILLACFFIVSFIFCFVSGYHMESVYWMNAGIGGDFSSNAIRFYIQGRHGDVTIKQLKDCCEGNVTLVQDYSGNYLTYRTYLLCGKSVPDGSVWLGDAIADLLGQDKFSFEGTEYQINKRMDAANNPSVDHMIYFSNSDMINRSKAFILDSTNANEISQTFEAIQIEFQKQGFDVKRVESSKLTLSDFIKYQKPAIMVLCFVYVLLIAAYVMSAYLWLHHERQALTIEYIYGCEKLYRRVLMYTGLYMIVALACGVVAIWAFRMSIIVVGSACVLFLCAALLSIAISCILYRRNRSRNLIEVMNCE